MCPSPCPPKQTPRPRSDGFPRAIPIGFHWNGSQIVICTAATAPKVKALSSRPEVAPTIDVGDTPTEAKARLIRGVATLDIVDGVSYEYVAASTKVLDPDQVAEFERHARSLYDQMTRITPAAMGTVLRLRRWPRFLKRLASDA